MQSYVLNLSPSNLVRAFDVPADLFVYESGAPTPTTGETRIKVKPNTGAEIVLRPGQRFRLAPDSNATHWEVSALDPSVTLAGYVIIGSGEFDDANTLNKVTLDATFANQVTVTNTTASRVPVALDPTAVLNTNQNIMQYTGSWEYGTLTTAPVAVVLAASNINGVDIKQVQLFGAAGTSGHWCLIAKTGAVAPTNFQDGDVLECGALTASTTVGLKFLTGVRVPAGKTVWFYSTADNATGLNKSVLFSLL